MANDAEELLDVIKLELINTLEKIPNKNDPYLISGHNKWTAQEVANEIKSNSEMGISMIVKILNLTLDLINRNKIKE